MGTVLFFGNDKCQHGVFFVAHAEADAADALFFQPFRQGGGVEEFGFAQCVMPDADVAEGNRAAYARADSFGEGFFGGKAFGEVVDGLAACGNSSSSSGVRMRSANACPNFLLRRMMRLRETMSVPMP